MSKSKKYFDREYGPDHIKQIVESGDLESLYKLMEEYNEKSGGRPSDLDDDEWWCPNCQEVVPHYFVTYEERHIVEGCYCKVI